MNVGKTKKSGKWLVISAALFILLATIIIGLRTATPIYASTQREVYVENGITYYYLRADETGMLDDSGKYAILQEMIIPENYGTEIVIPSSIDGYITKVVELEVYRWTSEYSYGEQLKREAVNINKITIPTGTIVYGLYGNIKDSLEQIVIVGSGTLEFSSTDGLDTTTGGGAYKLLKSIVATDGAIVKFGSCSFKNSPMLKEVSCYIEELGEQAFAKTGLTEIKIANPGRKVVVNRRIFSYGGSSDASKLSKVEFDAKEVILYDDCFCNTSITELTNPNGELIFAVSDGRDYYGPFGFVATMGNETLKKISAKDGVDIDAALGQGTWGQLKNLETVENIKTLCENALSYCPDLKNVTFMQGANITEIPASSFNGCTSLENIELPDTITKIYGFAFANSGLVEITVPDTVTEMEPAFYGCTSLRKISMPVIDLKYNYFSGCSSLNEIHFTSGGRHYCNLSFLGIKNFVNIYIDDGVEDLHFSDYDLEEVSFDYKIYANRDKLSEENCQNFKEYEYTRTLKQGEQLSGRYVYTVDSYDQAKIVEYLYNSKETRIDIPERLDGHLVYGMADNSFSKCYNVEEITIPNGMHGFGRNDFKNCTKLSKMELPTLWVYSIYEGTFSTDAMTRIEIPGNVKYVFFDAISNCANLEEVVIKEGVKTLDCHFQGCDSLKRIYVPKSVENIYCSDSLDRTYYVYKDSYALQYMQQNGLKYVIVDAESSDGNNGSDDSNSGSAGSEDNNNGGDNGNTEELSSYYNITVNGGTWDGTHYYLPSGTMVYNAFFSDGTYTYYLQADGTPMKDRLTYHPDGVHVIYFDADGHEVFSDFAHISKSIAGTDVDDMCFFNVYGYMYVDTLTYDKTGTKLYYVNPYGVLERNGWFQFSGHEFDAGLGFSGKAGGYGYANWDCSLMVNTNTYDWNGNLVYMQGDGHMAQ